MKRKFEGINILQLYTSGDTQKWNMMLTDCLDRCDINKLARIRYQISVGMTDLAKNKLNSDDLNTQFARWMRSLEITAKKIIKIKNPMPGDVMNNIDLENTNEDIKLKYLNAKRKRDEELKDFFRQSSF